MSHKAVNKDTGYMVWKLEEILQVCTSQDFKLLDTIIDRVIKLRETQGKPPTESYLVINTNEPYYNKVQSLINKVKEDKPKEEGK